MRVNDEIELIHLKSSLGKEKEKEQEISLPLPLFFVSLFKRESSKGRTGAPSGQLGKWENGQVGEERRTFPGLTGEYRTSGVALACSAATV